MSPSVEFQDVVRSLLEARAAVTAIIGNRIYDRMPSDGDYPCITFGPSDFTPDDVECISGRRETLQLDCWTQAEGRLWPCRELADAVRKALHLVDANMTVNALVSLRVGSARVFGDPDGVTAHGVVPVIGRIEEA